LDCYTYRRGLLRCSFRLLRAARRPQTAGRVTGTDSRAFFINGRLFIVNLQFWEFGCYIVRKTDMDIISSNPYRLLGVYSNSPIKDRIANVNRLKAYLKVGKSVSFSQDLSNLISPPVRVVESMERANGSINLPYDQLKYALFWFIEVTSIDEMALSYLQKGDTEKAKELFGKKETFSSLINLGVLALIQNNKVTAIQSITKVIHNDNYRIAFIEAVCGSTYQLSEDDLAQLFINELLVEIPIQNLMQLFLKCGASVEDNRYLKDKAVGEPIAIINAEIAKARSVKNNDSDAQYRAGLSLKNNTKEPLGVIRSLLEISDMQYQMIVDNLAKQILQCGINYYNNSNEDEYVKIDTVYELQSYAYAIAIGKLTKDRCKENLEILNKKRKDLPPIIVKEYDKFIKTELLKYQALPGLIKHAIDLIKKCTPYLMSIKEELGNTDSYYLRLSTLIVNAALYNVIEEFNSINNQSIQHELLMDRGRIIRKVKAVFQEAWIAILYMDKLDMEKDFRINRYSQNRASLEEQVLGLGISTYQTIQLDMSSESQMFKKCKDSSSCQRYLSVFPNGKFVAEIEGKMEKYDFDACMTTQNCSAFRKKYPDSKLPISQKWEYCFFYTCKTLESYQKYLDAYPNGRYISSAKNKIEEMTFQCCKTIDDYKMYLQKYPLGKYKDEAEKNIAEAILWQNCITSETKNEYRNYLAQFPDGKHRVEAQCKINEGGIWATILSWGFIIAVIIILTIGLCNN